ncbi:hypothetical protein EOD41_04385 [Mucilaginibacter limnophilus]|uniref:DUF4468 domain-containing protein n=1 Tax=Mucilaginibacter limnophilus TaxID=1932778 RepID=A0A437MU74_9SPHI|nr:hypothetical protein [Mucilaginibacter limnophilus]RVU01210.1 hypothetical protein EOD41_04385 [Mucilaginibacter limnophilus]
MIRKSLPLLVLLFALQVLQAYSQTREESITWLKKNMLAAFPDDAGITAVKKVTDCEVVVTGTSEDGPIEVTFSTIFSGLDQEGNISYEYDGALMTNLDTRGQEISRAMPLKDNAKGREVARHLKNLASHCSTPVLPDIKKMSKEALISWLKVHLQKSIYTTSGFDDIIVESVSSCRIVFNGKEEKDSKSRFRLAIPTAEIQAFNDENRISTLNKTITLDNYVAGKSIQLYKTIFSFREMQPGEKDFILNAIKQLSIFCRE